MDRQLWGNSNNSMKTTENQSSHFLKYLFDKTSFYHLPLLVNFENFQIDNIFKLFNQKKDDTSKFLSNFFWKDFDVSLFLIELIWRRCLLQNTDSSHMNGTKIQWVVFKIER